MCRAGAHAASMKSASKHIVRSRRGDAICKHINKSMGRGYTTTACVGIRKRILNGNQRSYMICRRRTYVASRQMSFADACTIMKTNSTAKLVRRVGASREPTRAWIKRYKLMRQVFSHYKPADMTANLAFLEQGQHCALPHVAPAVFMMGILSKAANYQRFLVKHFMALPECDKQLVGMISSPYKKQARQGCEIMLALETSVHKSLATPRERAFTSWNQHECNKFVAHHMGWLTQAQRWKTLVKMSGVLQANRTALQLTDKHCYIPVSKLTQRIAQRYITLARFGASAVAAASYDTFENISRASGFCKPTYHHKWAFRSILQATRQYAKVSKLKLKASTTVEEFENVFPDQSKYLKTLAGYYKTRSVKQIMRHL